MLELTGVRRCFGDVTAIDDVSFTVPRGTLTGFVGSNGAGKTTTMRLIMGVLAPTAGRITWDGAPMGLAQRRTIGYMPEERGLYPKQRVAEQLRYLAELRGQSRRDAKADVTALLDRLGLAGRVDTKLEELSLGNQQRVQIAASMLGRPQLLVLDEPFSGLDPIAVDDMLAMLREATGRGCAVLFSSHQLDLVERICDRLVILKSGTVIAEGSVDELRNSGSRRHRIVTGADTSWVSTMPGIVVDGHDHAGTIFHAEDDRSGQALLSEALRRGTVLEFRELVPTVTDLYRELIA